MEAATTPPAVAAPEALTAVEGSANPENEAALKHRPAVFTYSDYVSLPAECAAEDEKAGSCQDPEHFHAWFRLPNKFQHKELRDKAMAARARKQRLLRDEQSDAFEVLESEMDALLRADKTDIVDELVEQEAFKDQAEAIKDVAEVEDDHQPEDADEPVLKYANIEEDRKRLDELQNLPEDQRDQDDFEGLLRHVTAYYEAVEARVEELQQPRREALESKEQAELVTQIRDSRISAAGLEEFLHTYNTWGLLVGTLHADKSGRKFGDLEHMKLAAPEVIVALEEVQRRLEQEAQEGNS